MLPIPVATSKFTKYTLTDEEILQGYQVSILTLANLYNLQAQIAEEKLQLTLDPSNINKFVQEEAYKAGQLDILSYLIDEMSIVGSKPLNIKDN